MSFISDKPRLSANFLAGLLLIGLGQLRELGLLQMSAKEICATTGATRSRAYELANAILSRRHELEAPVGRPAATTDTPCRAHADALTQISRRMITYLLEHPGAAQRTTSKTNYSRELQGFVVQQCVDHPELDTAAIAEALTLPATTVRDWLRAANEAVEQASNAGTNTDTVSTDTTTEPPAAPSKLLGALGNLHIQTVLTEWSSWNGTTFSGFCEHLRHHHRLPFGRTTIASILEQAGVRVIRKRPGRSPDEQALRGAFASFFPGAVWTADGCELTVDFEGQRFGFNLELIVDTHSGAFVGLDVRDHEDAAALIHAFAQGTVTTLAAPLALLVDNKAPNHAPAVHEVVDEHGTILIPATLGRPQNKGHVEGAFGLFSQCAPPMRLDDGTAKQRARQLVELCVQIFFSALNMRPRPKRGGRSRIDLYRESDPTPEQIEDAIAALRARFRKQIAAKETRRARIDPVKRAYLEDAFARLHLSDPTGQFQASIARYDLDDIATGVAIFAGKKHAERLPDEVDNVRYLGGIVRNVARERVGMAIATALWDERIKARDFVFAPLIAKRDALADTDLDARLVHFVDQALAAERQIERYFWLDAASEVVLAYAPSRRRSVFEGVARRIHTAYRAPHDNREGAMQVIAKKVLPLL